MHKYFADSVWGGKSKALKAARAYRDGLIATSSGAQYVLWRRNWETSRNTSGVVGVCRYVRRGRWVKGPVWQAFWNTADGVRRSRTFAVNTHGERRAKQLACEARRKGMTELRQELIRRGMIYGS
ncbi:MAG TPA: AP2/ERF family transcription factor [Rhizomicrobium sp.]|nr:AP2/ERF family transcription factor [Rhizomicrobium sp.]